MDASTAPKLTVTLTLHDAARFAIEISAFPQGSHWTAFGSVERLRAANGHLARGLLSAKDTYAGVDKRSPILRAAKTLASLHDAGRIYADMALGKAGALGLKRFLSQNFCGSLAKPGKTEVTTPSALPFMFGLIPMGQIPSLYPDREEHIDEMVKQLPGFNSVIKRILVSELTTEAAAEISDQGQMGQGAWIRSHPPHSLRFYWNSDAPGAEEERRELESLRDASLITLSGPLPDLEAARLAGLDDDRLATQLVGAVAFQSAMAGEGSQLPYQFLHVVAHSRVGDPGLQDASVIELGYTVPRFLGRDEFHPVLINDGLLDRVLQMDDVGFTENGPVAVINSCSSIAFADYESRGIVGNLLALGYRAVIGAETRIPGTLGVAFVRHFYDSVMKGGKSVGIAVHEFRRERLKMADPRGILIGTFGETDLKIRSPDNER